MAAKPDRRARLALILERDGHACVWCRRELEVGLVEATTEHVVPRLKGGPSWIENEVAACGRCNAQRRHLTPAEWIDECEQRGWEPDRQTIVAVLMSLEVAIERRGGQRRARTYVHTQLRRLRDVERPATPLLPRQNRIRGLVTDVDCEDEDEDWTASTGSRPSRRSS